MILEKGNMFDVWGSTDLFLVTTNPIRRQDGAIVMGRGIAKQVADQFPEIPYDFGCRLAMAEYGRRYLTPADSVNIGVIGTYKSQTLGWFMVKSHWRSAAQLDIIADSTVALAGWAGGVARRFSRIDLNFPGIGNGKLRREDVLPIISKLPDNVHVWEYGE